MPEFEIDKCTENFNIRIPEITKHYLDRLPQNLKSRLKDMILRDMEKIIHESMFTPGKYLKTDGLWGWVFHYAPVGWICYDDYPVTHWMPLPDKPIPDPVCSDDGGDGVRD